ncbi:hypothetical protein KIK06_23505 [Nocardiopsis sp. EMB25]|uniref:hypothetical protein n=1 Tax=Nocardiopsis sp. EMB25 TaxID=2835867 RepID=UPI002284A128|nr:hypothetical protein [Nocardiopsis sp. EMB25]MCY9786854.1 hypothetical protein [Nocardiopsis sp. EMB25]
MTVTENFPGSQKNAAQGHIDPGVHMVGSEKHSAPPPNEECTTLDHGRWHFCPDNAGPAHHGCVNLDVTPDNIRATANQPAPGTVLNLTPATPGWTIILTQGGQSWASPIVAWAALASNYGTGMIDPVLVADGQTVTLQNYLEGRGPLLEVLDGIDYDIAWAPPGVATPTTPGDLSALATVAVTGCWTLADPTRELTRMDANGHWPTREEAEAHRAKLAEEGFVDPDHTPVRHTGTCRAAVCATCGTHRTSWEGNGRHYATAAEAIAAAVTAGRTDQEEWEPADAWQVRPDGRLNCPTCR